ncbi:MAG TPA: tyrosine-type recombinase/integrase [Acidimicrobiales bacterium]|nr:tyrosine-type recombinase/integrase [Acidimicrobiales bacterium]
MPRRPEGVYLDQRGGWYVKITVGVDPLSGRRVQLTRRGFDSMAEAVRARRELLATAERGQLRPASPVLDVGQLLDLYLDGLDADERLSAKTRFDYRHYADSYVRPLLGGHKVRDVTPDLVLAWQRRLAKNGGTKNGKPLAPNTIRLARAPLAGAFRMAQSMGLIGTNPLAGVPRPAARRSIPRHWSPEQAREFLALMQGDRTYPIWAFLLGSGLRIGELVWLRWRSVDLERRRVHVVEFASTLGWDLAPSAGKSRDAVRSIELDDGLVAVLRLQRRLQAAERLAARQYEESEYVFTKAAGGAYHPQVLSRLLGRETAALGLPRLTAHGLRHTSATLMLANGVPAKVAAERLGHADPTLFTNLYSHVTQTMQREAAEKIGAALFG